MVKCIKKREELKEKTRELLKGLARAISKMGNGFPPENCGNDMHVRHTHEIAASLHSSSANGGSALRTITTGLPLSELDDQRIECLGNDHDFVTDAQVAGVRFRRNYLCHVIA